MYQIRHADDRGLADFGWLKSRHSFSFGQYYDRNHMGFGPLRVINDDRVAAARGFDTHPHDNMEILTWVVSGALEHRDSMGESSIIRPGDLQRMSAGTGVTHSEFNASQTDPVHFLQIWISPEAQGLKPSYEQRHFDDLDGNFRLIAARDGRDGALTVHRDVDLYAGQLDAGQNVQLPLRDGRGMWLQMISGQVTAHGQKLTTGDGLALIKEPELTLTADEDAAFLLFDLAA
ncbi:pirin family protein [uncultured Pelagimonas sp.]|uniref:pirin family protein n=1 Tax=uncultured Pelagimonas sp. TaxID=1618102 RepID=UPI0026026E22|nr:pirin family protein [uncultured Pelagimonas sp.]